MNALIAIALAVLLTGQAPEAKTPRKPNPLAPSLPQLTEEEEADLDRIVERFIQYDIGRLQGKEGLDARREFDRLGPESVFALIRGLNKSAEIEHSCPVVVIAQKLRRMLGSSIDSELLEFARENIGIGIGQTRHKGVLQDLRVAVMLRKQAVARAGITVAGPVAAPATGDKSLRSMSTSELTTAAGSERGEKLKGVLTELEQRRGKEVVAALGVAAASYEKDVRQLGRDLLVRNLSRATASELKENLKDDRAEVRRATVLVIGQREPRLTGEVIELITDDDADVRSTVKEVLLRKSRVDLGPAFKASKDEQEAARKRWRDWWARQDGK